MNDNIELLSCIYKNSKMGIIGIENIKDAIKDKTFLKLLKKQENEYYEICTKTIKLLSLANSEKEEISPIAKLMTYMDAKMETMFDDSISKIAKMMIKGTDMGIIEMTEKINNYEGTDRKIIALAKELIRIEKNNIEELKKYL